MEAIEMEGRARWNNVRIYGILEEAEGTSATAFVVNMIKTQLSEDIDPNSSSDLGTEHAHRALAVKISADTPLHSMVVCFLQFMEILSLCSTRSASSPKKDLSCISFGVTWTVDLLSQVYKWQVLPFGTTSSLCCPIYAL